MIVLAFDTCFGAVSAAVCRHEAGEATLLAEAYEARTTGHAERLLPMVEETLRAAGLAFRQVDRFAVTVGPGTFTGVRAGIAAARALALATGKPSVGMGSLAVMAHTADVKLGAAAAGRPLLVAVDARAGMVYAQMFAADRSTGVPQLMEPEAAASLTGGKPAIVLGSGGAMVADAAGKAGGTVEVLLPDLQPHARELALRAADIVPDGPVRPHYLRRPDAKPQGDKSLPRVST